MGCGVCAQALDEMRKKAASTKAAGHGGSSMGGRRLAIHRMSFAGPDHPLDQLDGQLGALRRRALQQGRGETRRAIK